MESFFLSHCKGTTFGRGAFRLGMARRVSSAFFCFLLDVDVEFGDDELDDVGWQYLVVGLHAHGGELVLIGLAPAHEGLYADAGILRQL